MAKKLGKLKMIGWRERITLPELGLVGLKVKVDSGARTSALHATKIHYLLREDGETWVSFHISKGGKKSVRVRAPLIEQRKVKSSMGHASVRPVIRTSIELGGEVWPIEVTLVNRDPMGFRMLLGRSALKNRFVIHPSRSFIQSPRGSEK